MQSFCNQNAIYMAFYFNYNIPESDKGGRVYEDDFPLVRRKRRDSAAIYRADPQHERGCDRRVRYARGRGVGA